MTVNGDGGGGVTCTLGGPVKDLKWARSGGRAVL